MLSDARWQGLKNHITGGLSIAQSLVWPSGTHVGQLPESMTASLVCIKSEWITICRNTYFGFVFLKGDCILRAK